MSATGQTRKDLARPVLVTGASSGIGRTIVEHLASKGHDVFAGARKSADIQRLSRLPGVTALKLDVTDAREVEGAVETIRKSGRGLYGLVNNAGVAGIGPLIETPVQEMNRVLAVNLIGVHRMVHASSPMIVHSRGRIVNISTIGGLGTMTWFGPYGTSKHALEGYSDILREEMALLGVHVSVIEPGPFRSKIGSSYLDPVRRANDSLVREGAFRKGVEGAYAFVEALNGDTYPEPLPVAEAVSDALFSPTPKTRYLVTSRDWTTRILNRLLDNVRIINAGSSNPLTKHELEESLRKIFRTA